MKRRDLALQYFPDKTPVEAVRTLRRWIDNCPQLTEELRKLNPNFKCQKDLTIRQVRLIMDYLGDPWKGVQKGWPNHFQTECPKHIPTECPIHIPTECPIQLSTECPIQLSSEYPIQLSSASPIQLAPLSPIQTPTGKRAVMSQKEPLPK